MKVQRWVAVGVSDTGLIVVEIANGREISEIMVVVLVVVEGVGNRRDQRFVVVVVVEGVGNRRGQRFVVVVVVGDSEGLGGKESTAAMVIWKGAREVVRWNPWEKEEIDFFGFLFFFSFITNNFSF